jgi:anaphase-promoting complex subunit 1
MHQQELEGCGTSGVLSKKKRASDSGSESDWDYLLLSGHHRALGHGLACLLGMQPVDAVGPSSSPPPVPQINSNAILFSSIPLIVFSLHLLYEVCTVITQECSLVHWGLNTWLFIAVSFLSHDK